MFFKIPGWGATENNAQSEKLMTVQMPVVSQSACIWSKPEFFGRITSDTTFCAGFRNGID